MLGGLGTSAACASHGGFGNQGLLRWPCCFLNSKEGAQMAGARLARVSVPHFVSLIPREEHFAFYSTLWN